MRYYEVLIADGHYHASAPLTYSSEDVLPVLSVVTVPLRARAVTGFILSEPAAPPQFKVKPIKAVVSAEPLPFHSLELAQWIGQYYSSTLAEALRQFAPSRPTIRRKDETRPNHIKLPGAELDQPLTAEQKTAIKAIESMPSTTVLLHGDTGTGKTRVYLELARKTLAAGRSVIMLTPEISLTTQLQLAAQAALKAPVYVLHSQLSMAARKKIWFQILEAKEPVVIIGPRSALFSPVKSLGLIILDEAHEPAYKQDQAPRYHAARVASQLGTITGARVILGTATPSISDYYLADQKKAVVKMTTPAKSGGSLVTAEIVDLKNRSNFSRNPYISNQMIKAVTAALNEKKQAIIYLNKRGSARSILCKVCGWHFFCPNCDVPLVYHGDQHLARCHICGYKKQPPAMCPKCNNPEIIYRSIGTKALITEVEKLFPNARLGRFDSDNSDEEQLHNLYSDLHAGKIDILVGTQLLAKGLDLPNLKFVGVVNAETSLALPDFTSEERAYQLLYQIIGRVGRGHGDGEVIVQAHDPNNIVIQSALRRSWPAFYKHALTERQQFRFPPFSYLLQLTVKRATEAGAAKASDNLRAKLLKLKLPVEIIGPSPSFYARRGKYYYYQLVIKAKNRGDLLKLAASVPADWQINLDPIDLL